MNRRKDYKEFKQLLEKYNITKFYHFTDHDNVDSIIKNGGLFSYGDCIKRGIRINRPGGSALSHELDYKENLQNYVRVSLCKKHPMMFTAIQDERIVNPVILEIDTDVLFIEGNIFSDKNAVRKDSCKGKSFADFSRIHFNTVKQRNQFEVDDDEQDYYQAEILVPHHISLNYILNLTDFQTLDSERKESCLKIPYSSAITRENPAGIFFILNQSYPTEEKIEYGGEKMSKARVEGGIVDKVINELILSNTSNGVLNDKYNISVIGYGDYAYSCFEKGNVQTLKELQDNPLFVRTMSKKTKTRQGTKTIEIKQPTWIKTNSDGDAKLYKALNKARDIIENWAEEHESSYPPIVIHITEYRYHGADDSDMKQMANQIKSIFTKDGNALFFNIILTEKEDAVSVLFPYDNQAVSDSYYGTMYCLMSSILPKSFNQNVACFNEIEDVLCQRYGIAFNVKFKDLFDTILSIIPK